ncbi:hypothetical protein O7628_32355 [Micromonospora sp. WMMD956]|uniref:hypothetical protein n=1 Tax=Micromonospora sp. WMMD956 TaxID=3016108 RepID=UPI0024164157|nr:hypothetical protein [Micromonospora sp. WMMD956]MDG4820199.1 hypothetical protein [Micromonospora sp. WMMD956]
MTDRASRELLWGQVPVGQALLLLSCVLRDLDLEDAPEAEIEARWAAQLPGEAASRARAAIAGGRRLLPPQLLLVAFKEALVACPPGPARDDLSNLDVVLQAVFSIADELGQVRDGGEPRWGGLKATLAAELLANQYFNATAHPAPLMARSQVTWREGWSSAVGEKERIRAGGQPAELFAEATGCALDAFLGVATHLWVQAYMHKYLHFPPEFFGRLGIDPVAIDLFLDATSVSLADLQQQVAQQTPATEQPWEFNALRRRPIVRLPDGSVQVIRVGFVLERAFGQVPEFDVADHLRRIDGGTDQRVKGGREEAFRSCLNSQFEYSIGELLRRIFPASGHFKRLYSENDMWHAWTKAKGRKPSVCDWVVDCGDVWICLDANNRRLSQPVVGGQADVPELDKELAAVLAGNKARQMASTIRHLTELLPQLTGRNLVPGTRFVPLIVTPDDGLPWNPAVHRRVQEVLAANGTLQTSRATALGVISLQDLGLVEYAADNGRDAGNLLATWRSQQPEVALQHFMYGQGEELHRPQWVTDTFSQVVDELVEQQTRYLENVPGSPSTAS